MPKKPAAPKSRAAAQRTPKKRAPTQRTSKTTIRLMKGGAVIVGDTHCADFVAGNQKITYGFTACDVERMIEKVLTFLQAGAVFLRTDNHVQAEHGRDTYQDQLVCPGCSQPVRVRAGEIRQWHFAHKHLQNCPYDYESPILLETRALLYKWLTVKFKKGFVTVEKKLEGIDFPRHIDCWVEIEGKRFAYWIFDARVPLHEREQLSIGMTTAKVNPVWVFVADLLRSDDTDPQQINLTTTERDFICPSRYDESTIPPFQLCEGSLHYLDAKQARLETFRGLHLVHSPQLYVGHRESSLFSEVLVLGSSGEFVHPGEHERRDAFLKEKEKSQKSFPHHEPTMYSGSERVDCEKPKLISSKGSFRPIQNWNEEGIDLQPQSIFEREVECAICGKWTTDWQAYNGLTKKCKCRACNKKEMQ